MPRSLTLLSGLLVGACSVVGIRSGTEEPPYRTLSQLGPVEIREYGPRIAAETTIQADQVAARSTGFQRLAGYIFGRNTTRATIAMTAPVAQSQTIAMTAPVAQDPAPDGAWTIRFFMPAKSTMETLPTPLDPTIRLVPVPPQTYAVLRYTGFYGAGEVARHQATLLAALSNTPWRPTGPPMSWFYDPPWTLPFLRRNEAVVQVARP